MSSSDSDSLDEHFQHVPPDSFVPDSESAFAASSSAPSSGSPVLSGVSASRSSYRDSPGGVPLTPSPPRTPARRKADIIAAYRKDGGIVTTYRSPAQTQQRKRDLHTQLEIEALKSQLDHAEQEVVEVKAQLRDDMAMAREMHKDCEVIKRELDGLEDEIVRVQSALTAVQGDEELQAELARLQTRHHGLQVRYDGARVKYAEHLEDSRATEEALTQAELERDQLQLEYVRVEELEQELRARAEAEGEEAQVVAEYQAKVQRRLQRKVAKRRVEKHKRKKEEQRVEQEKRQREREAALKATKLARTRLQKDLGHVRKREREAKLERKRQLEERARGIISLKKNIEAARSTAAEQSQRRASRAARRAKKMERERQQLLAQGRNPEAVFAVRREEARISAKQRALAERIKTSEMKILDTLVQDDADHRRREAARRRKAEAVQRHRDALGRHVTERRNEQYLRSRLNGNDLMDPTGREFHLKPSKFVTVKRRAFGTGRAADDELEATRARFPTVKPHDDDLPRERTPRLQYGRTVPKASSLPDLTVGPPPDAIGTFMGADTVPLDAAISSGDDAPPQTAAAANSNSDSDSDAHEARLLHKKKSGPVGKPLSEGEKLRLQRANARHHELIQTGKVEPICGKTYDNVSKFISDPPCLEFLDFTVGKRVSKTFTLTNVSFTFNSFRILELPERLADFFTVTYKRPGRMSAGISARIRVTFTPKVNEDIDDEIPALAETGPFSIPLRCRARKAHIVVSPDTGALDFGSVALGDSSTRHVRIENKGALEVSFFVVVADGGDVSLPAKKTLVSIPGYSKISYPVRFTPSEVGDVRTASVRFVFGRRSDEEGDVAMQAAAERRRELQWASEKEFTFALSGSGQDVPIYVANPELDFQLCSFGKLYRAPLFLHNRTDKAMKVQMRVPKLLRGFVELSPSIGFVQGDTPFPVQVRFSPTAELLERYHRANADQDGNSIAVQVRILVPDQTLPVYFTLKAQLAPPGLEFSVSQIDFGTCFTSQSAALPVRVTNASPLAQQLAFSSNLINGSVTVQPGDGLISLLPNETKDLSVVFSPDNPVRTKFDLRCNTLPLGQSYSIPCHAQCAFAPVTVSHPVLNMAAVGVGDTETMHTVIQNTSSQTRQVEVVVPDDALAGAAHLTVSPLVMVLKPKQAVRVQVDFKPPHDLLEEAENQAPSEPGKPSPALSKISFSDAPSRHGVHLLAVHTQGVEEPQYVRVETTAIAPQLVAKPSEVDFGQVSVGSYELMVIDLTNLAPLRDDGGQPELSELHMQTLGVNSPFSVLNAIRPIASGGGVQKVVVEFRPLTEKRSRETLVISSATAKVSIPLLGQGVLPNVLFEDIDDPDRTYSGFARAVVDMGHLRAGEIVERTVNMRNRSSFPLKFEFTRRAIDQTHARASEQNHNGLSPFIMFPRAGVLAPDEVVEMKFRFAPDHESIHYAEEFVVANRVVAVRGKAWSQPMFVDKDRRASQPVDEVVPQQQDPLAFLAHADDDALPARTVTLEAGGGDEAAKAELHIGTCQDGGELPSEPNGGAGKKKKKGKKAKPKKAKKGKGGSFEVVLDDSLHKACWQVEPRSGSVSPGDVVPVTVSFNREQFWASQSSPEMARLVEQWVKTRARVVFKVPGEAAMKEQELKLEVFLGSM